MHGHDKSQGHTAATESRHPRRSHSANCLTHTLMCKPMLRSEAERVAQRITTATGISLQHLKESAVPNTCPKTMDPQNAVPLASPLPCQHP